MRGKDNKVPAPLNAVADVQGKEQNYILDIIVVRTIFAITLTLAAYFIQPLDFEVLPRSFLVSPPHLESSISNTA